MSFFDNMSAKQGLIMGLSWGIAGVALIALLIVFGGGFSANQDGGLGGNVNANSNVNTNQGNPTQPSAAGDISKVAAVTSSDHIRGDKNAKITLLEYSDFQCPYCQRHVSTMEQVLEDYDGKVRLVFRNFPLTSIHPYAQKAAEAAECAGEQGKFWEMHDILFDNQSALSIDNLKGYARQLGLNQSQFNSCLDDGKYAAKINQQAAEAQAAGITGTPGTFVGSQLVKGAYPYDTFKQIIDGLLSQ